MQKLKAAFELIKETFSEWSADNASRLAAALSYYTIFSLTPLLIIVIAIAGLIFGREAVQDQIVGQTGTLIGEQGSEGIRMLLDNASAQPESGIFAAVVGAVTLFFGAMGVFAQLKGALNTIWNVQPNPNRGILGTIKDNLLSFTMVLGIGFMLLVSLVIQAAMAAFTNFLGTIMPFLAGVLPILNFLMAFAVITVLFAMIYKVLPDANIAWKDVAIGAVVTALLFTAGQFLVGLYLGRSSVASTYGAAGSLVIILIWIYYSAQILFLGAEFTQVYARKYGSGVVPADNAVIAGSKEEAKEKVKQEDKAARTPAPLRQPLPQVTQPWLTPLATRTAYPVTPRKPPAAVLFGGITALLGLVVGLAVSAFRSLR